MGSLSDYLENKLLLQIFNGTAYTFPATVYLGLYTANPSDSGGGTEVSGGSYARKSVVADNTKWTVSGTSPTQATTAADLTFATATADWGTVTAVGIFDASSGGNLLAWAALSASKTISNGDTATITAGSLTITLD